MLSLFCTCETRDLREFQLFSFSFFSIAYKNKIIASPVHLFLKWSFALFPFLFREKSQLNLFVRNPIHNIARLVEKSKLISFSCFEKGNLKVFIEFVETKNQSI